MRGNFALTSAHGVGSTVPLRRMTRIFPPQSSEKRIRPSGAAASPPEVRGRDRVARNAAAPVGATVRSGSRAPCPRDAAVAAAGGAGGATVVGPLARRLPARTSPSSRRGQHGDRRSRPGTILIARRACHALFATCKNLQIGGSGPGTLDRRASPRRSLSRLARVAPRPSPATAHCADDAAPSPRDVRERASSSRRTGRSRSTSCAARGPSGLYRLRPVLSNEQGGRARDRQLDAAAACRPRRRRSASTATSTLEEGGRAGSSCATASSQRLRRRPLERGHHARRPARRAEGPALSAPGAGSASGGSSTHTTRRRSRTGSRSSRRTGAGDAARRPGRSRSCSRRSRPRFRTPISSRASWTRGAALRSDRARHGGARRARNAAQRSSGGGAARHERDAPAHPPARRGTVSDAIGGGPGARPGRRARVPRERGVHDLAARPAASADSPSVRQPTGASSSSRSTAGSPATRSA